ncbi:MerR family transcriptional regulator [Chamaesiphon sp. OTE_8_metabat_110]|uniref:MerR family transcriptional regulator n=1 Tax=Chamaesiphon sp. OTE_8_metabat_110 TaxID=2964696 RepID=UPI00286C8895|nr:MerR family transcriptional regulator [Chamaesiphon sp. OTE_8_metabat_110]
MASWGTIDSMQEPFFTSKQASDISGCTLRQLQYWREKEIVVPTVGSQGTGRSVYYSPSEVVELGIMEYCLGAGLNMEIADAALKALKEKSPDSIQTVSQSWLLSWDGQKRVLDLVDFDETQAVEWLQAGRVMILLLLDEYEANNGLLVAATNLTRFLDEAVWRRFDDTIEVPKPTQAEIEGILKQTLSSVETGKIDWQSSVSMMIDSSAAQVVRVAQDAAKRAILDREELVVQKHLEQSIQEILTTHVRSF